MDLKHFADDVGPVSPVTIAGLSTRGGPVTGVRCVSAPSGIDWLQADEMTICCGAGTPVDQIEQALRSVGQRTVLPSGGTVGGALSAGRSSVRRLGDGPLRDAVLQVRYVSAAGSIVTAGGPTVKNVSGFDVCRLLVGARGTLGFMGEVLLRTRPLPLHSAWFSVVSDRPMELFQRLHRPVAVLWDGARVWVLLEGHPLDVEAMALRCGLEQVDGPPPLPPERTVMAPSAQPALVDRLGVGAFVAELGVGVVHAETGALGRPAVADGVRRLSERITAQFDPTGRLNPGVRL